MHWSEKIIFWSTEKQNNQTYLIAILFQWFCTTWIVIIICDSIIVIAYDNIIAISYANWFQSQTYWKQWRYFFRLLLMFVKPLHHDNWWKNCQIDPNRIITSCKNNYDDDKDTLVIMKNSWTFYCRILMPRLYGCCFWLQLAWIWLICYLNLHWSSLHPIIQW